MNMEDIRNQINEANIAFETPVDNIQKLTRHIVNIERQLIYGDEPSSRRLQQIRVLIDDAVKELKK
jgi:hypothetical protein